MWKKHSPNKHRGQALIMTTLSLIPMFGLMGLAVDLGWMEFTKKSAQTAADAAAMAAVLQYQSTTFSTTITCGVGGVVCQAPTSCSPAPTSYLHSGCDYAQANGFSSSGNQYVSLESGTGAPPTASQGLHLCDGPCRKRRHPYERFAQSCQLLWCLHQLEQRDCVARGRDANLERKRNRYCRQL